MSRGRVLSKVGGLTQTISGISTFVGVSTFKSDVRIHGDFVVDGSTTLSTAIANSNLANSTVSLGGVTVALGAADATPAFNLSDATNYPTSSLSGTIANSQLANATVSFGGVSLSLGGTNNTPAFDLSDATNYPTSSLVGTITNAQLAGSIASAKLANTGVSAGTVGSSTAIPILTINAQGQVTNTSTTAIDSTTIENGTASVAVANNGPITSTGNHDFTAGIDVTGNITVSGTVDGRDLASDGTKLDGIESAATADQTAAEIRTLVDGATDSNVFTDADHTKLDGIETGATADQTDEEIQDIVGAMLSGNTETGITVTYQDGDGTIDFAVASQTDENFTTADHAKLDGIESGATADQTASEIRTLVDGATDSNVLTDALLTKLSGIETSATADQTAAEIRTLVEDASDSNVFTDADHSKLNGIEANATADQTDEEIQDIVGAMLTGNTESGITVTYQDADGTIDFSVASQTDENFTTADHSKLDGIEAGATADQTGAEIKSLYEGESDTNAFTDALLSKLNAIESGATADQTASDIKTLLASSKLTNAHIADDTITAALLADTSVSAGSYGSATAVPVITVDAQGRLTAVSTSSITTTTNLATSTDVDEVTITSSTGNNATISEASGSAAGVMSVAHHDKLDGIEANATADQTASEILTLLKTVDGAGSGLDADTLDGISSASFLRSDTSDTFTGTLTVSGAAAIDNLSLDGNTVTTSSGNLTIDSAGGTTTVADNLAVSGNLTVNGTTTTVNATTVNIADKNIQVATGAADDAAADGGGITIDSGDGDKTFQFEATGDNFGSSENLNLADGKVYKIDNTSVLSATTLGSSVTGSSLTSLGTISTGVWQGTAIANAYLANSTLSVGGVTLTLGATDATPAFNLSDATNYPTSSLSGTITNAQLAGSIASAKLANTGVSAGTVGSSTAIPIITVNAQGQITNTSTTAIDSTTIENGTASVAVANNGPITSTGNHDFTAGIDVTGDITGTGDVTITDTTADSNAGPEFKLFRNSASPATADYLGQIKFAGENDTGSEKNYAKMTGKILDASTGSEDGAIEFAHIKGGSQVITGRFRSDSLQLLNGTGLSVDGNITGDVIGNLTGNVTGNTSGSSGSCTGNAATATALQNARTIAGVSFDGTSNISLNNNAITNGAGYITSSGTSAACSGNSATATLAANSTITANNSTNETVYPVFVDGATGTQGLESDTGLSYNPSSNTLTTTTFVGALTGNVTGNVSGSSGSSTGNAATATKLANARTIAGVSFDGSANISLNNNAITNGAGYITSSGTSAACSGNSATATLATTSTNVTISANNSTNETVYPVFVDGATGTQGLESDTGLSYNPSSGNLTSTRFVGALTGNVTGNTSGSSGSCTGNAATATKLATARTIAGVSFDGSGNISLNNANITNGAGYVTQNTQLSDEQVQDIVGAMLTGNTESGITVTYQDSDGTIDFSVASQVETASQILTKIKTVDGSGSGLDADTLDGVQGSNFLRSNTADTMTATLTARTIVPQSDSTYDLGSNSVRWSNIYGDNIRTGDLHLSNEHLGGNEVDGTWGHYQIQEGEDDLFLFNKRSGKKYRFLLQQV